MSQCITVVQFATPPRSKQDAISAAENSAPTYRDLAPAGLVRKDFLNGESGGGGVYLWDERASAEAWFTPERIADLTQRFGVHPTIVYYDTYVTVDNVAGETRIAR
jgi:hypothetical protein